VIMSVSPARVLCPSPRTGFGERCSNRCAQNTPHLMLTERTLLLACRTSSPVK
jgi:hypothetical protein